MKKESKKSRKGVGGRPRKPIDWDLIGKLAEIHCTEAEIASVLGVATATLRVAAKRDHGCSFKQVWRQKAEGGKRALRRAMWNKALGGNVTMMIWLAKNHLGMTDKLDSSHKVDATVNASVTGDVNVVFESNGRELVTDDIKPDA